MHHEAAVSFYLDALLNAFASALWTIDNECETTDALFPRPDGTAFPSKYALNQFLWKHVPERFEWFHPYLGRHWSVNARLIDWDFDYARVSQWHGHESVNMTKNEYEQSARVYRALYGKDWLIRAFQKPAHRSKPEIGGIDAIRA